MEYGAIDQRPKGAVGVYIVKDGKICLYRRSSEHANNTWCPPGGHIEYGEDIIDTVKRETKEEAGIDVEEIEIMGITSTVYETEKKHYLVAHVLVKKYSGDPQLMEPDKFYEMRWFSLSDMPENMLKANLDFFAQNPPCLCCSGKKFNECHGK